MNRFLMDAHLHVDLYKDRNAVIEYIEQQHSYSIAVTNLPILFEKYQCEYGKLKYLKFALGYHPELVSEYSDQMPIFLRNIEKTRYIGEIGLDFIVKDPAIQKKQIEILNEIVQICTLYKNKVLNVHTRKAVRESLEILDVFKGKVILHWYTGTVQELQTAVDRGYYFSINHQMLKSASGRKIVENIPIDNVLIETDAPFTSGMKDAYNVQPIIDVYSHLAVKNNICIEKVMGKIKQNFKAILG